ncbi:hypothetical protein KRP22_010317 [Phytophthora ramorum]|uniref:uncharacterized protein n=1 Tax=Phytophthora ramorum TaxID=164328 RepID=UPI0030A31301|nr:hypothetical protein KRP23_4218 [Phytophthora ramorum]KAH7496242.1 hypothetical protein KRP22_14136 [Phytophthora ramorum]KAH7505340.1 hypothetical protein KRP22_5814 [Phytophthora ramorum]
MDSAIPLPASLTCRLSIKNGQPLEACRDKVPPSPSFVFDVADGHRVLRAKVEEHFSSKLPGQWNSNFDIYLKPANNAKQKHFEVLCQENAALLAQLENVWHRARLRRNGQAGFELELFVYVPKPEVQATSLRRATAARIQEQMPRVAAFVRERQIEAGEASQRYMAVTQARLPDGAPLTVPDSTTFRQLQHIDAQQAVIDRATDAEQQRADSEYCMVRVKLHGVPVPLEVNVVDLRAALGLPSYSLRPPFRPPTDIETPGPAMDIPDEEHTDERAEAMEN